MSASFYASMAGRWFSERCTPSLPEATGCKEGSLNMQILAVLGMGLTSILVQIIALRRLLTVFSGNELDIGITLAVWLLTVGIGSFIGHRFRSRHAFGLSFVVVALLCQMTVLTTSLIHPIFGLLTGETAPLLTTLFSTLLSLAPVCLAIGAQFPLAVAHLGGNASRTYGLEALGACVGGILFTFVLSGRVDAFTLATAISVMNIAIALLLFRRKRMVWLLALPLLLSIGVERVVENAPEPDLELVHRVESRYGEISVFEAQGQLNVYLSGRYEFAYPDAQAEELKSHVPASLLETPERILLIGGSPAVAREFLKYPVLSVDFLELDPEMIDVSFSLLSKDDRQVLSDSRLKIISQDGRRFIRSTATRYDLVVLNLPEPATANVNRFYTVEFFREAREALRAGGVLALTLPASPGYRGSRMQTANGTVYRSLKTVFANVALSSEEYGGMYASDGPLDVSPEGAALRFSQRRVATVFFQPLLFEEIFDPLKVNTVKARLETGGAINRDRRPVAYLSNLMLWADTYDGSALNRIFDLGDREILLLFSGALLITAALFWRKRQALYFTLFTTGYATMAFCLIVLLAYQTAHGYVYERIGLLTALFMAGSAAGASLSRSRKDLLRWLQLVDIGCLLLFLAAPLFFREEIPYYLLMCLCGVLGGAQYAAVNRYAEGKRPGELAGRLYGLDLSGSVLGALLTALFFVPLLGIGNAVLSLMVMKGSSFILLLALGHEKK
jgi:spermidine synthase